MLSLVRFYPVYVNNLISNFAAKETGPSSREKTHSAKRNVSRSKLKLNEVCVTLNSSLERERKRDRRGEESEEKSTRDGRYGKRVRCQRNDPRELERRMSVSEKKASKESVIVGKKAWNKRNKKYLSLDQYSVLIFSYYCKLKFIWIMNLCSREKNE